jgi:hypothetical protein
LLIVESDTRHISLFSKLIYLLLLQRQVHYFGCLLRHPVSSSSSTLIIGQPGIICGAVLDNGEKKRAEDVLTILGRFFSAAKL